MTKKSNDYKLIKENEIISRILSAMKSPTDRQKTWEEYSGQFNRDTIVAYQWINAFTLSYIKHKRGYKSSQWLTFKQAKKLWGYVKKWSESVTCKKYLFLKLNNKDWSPVLDDAWLQKKKCMPMYFNVFNLDDIEGIAPYEWELRDNEEIPTAHEVIDGYMRDNDVTLTYNWSGRNYYQVDKDLINMVDIKLFKKSEDFYHTFLHEISHSTGHPKRLARKKTVKDTNTFGSHKYCVEELVAEFSAAMTASKIWLPIYVENVASYLSWRASEIINNKREWDVSRAISMAKKSSDFILWENK